MKHHYLALATALLAATGVQADAKGTMTVNGSGAGAAIPVSSISRITFDDHTMNVATADGGSQAFDVNALSDITFDLSATGGVEKVTANLDDDLTVEALNGLLTFTATSGGSIDVKVYTTAGALTTAAAGEGSVSVDLTTLAKGVYLVRANNKTLKVAN